jgi:hypothetical protein
MKYPSPEYDAFVAKLTAEREAKMHKTTVMTESETQVEIEKVMDGAKSVFAIPDSKVTSEPSKDISNLSPVESVEIVLKRKRGRPFGSRNKPKPPKGS